MARKTIALFGAVLAALTVTVCAGTAVAAPGGGAAGQPAADGFGYCPPPPATSTPFSSLGDSLSYVLANDGTFDPVSGHTKESAWTLSGGASIVADNEPDNIGGGTTSSALSLPAGSSAQSACTTAPLITTVVRFFVKNTGSASGLLHVEILVNGGKNGVLDGGTITAGSDWGVSPRIVVPWDHPLNGAAHLQVRLTPVGSDAAFEVDDVYIDPYLSR